MGGREETRRALWEQDQCHARVPAPATAFPVDTLSIPFKMRTLSDAIRTVSCIYQMLEQATRLPSTPHNNSCRANITARIEGSERDHMLARSRDL